jgi:2-methylcitrate dehydratase PrpD
MLDVYFKRHACMRRTHAAVDATLEITRQRTIIPEAVEKILVHTSSYVAQLNNPVPTTIVAAQGSVPYSIAVALLYGKAGMDEFTLDRLGDPQIVALSKKVEFHIDPGLEKIWKENPQAPWPSGVEIILRSGERYSHKVDYPLGDPQNPISQEELEEKYGHMASYALPDRRKDLLKSKIYHLDSDLRDGRLYKDFM